VTEIMPWWGDPAPVADLVLDYLAHPHKLEAMRADLHQLVSTLDKPGASMNVARLALDLADRPRRAAVTPAAAV
jgi:hypothetical protein